MWQPSTDDVVLEIRTKLPDDDSGSGAAPIAAADTVDVIESRELRTYDGHDHLIALSVVAERRDA